MIKVEYKGIVVSGIHKGTTVLVKGSDHAKELGLDHEQIKRYADRVRYGYLGCNWFKVTEPVTELNNPGEDLIKELLTKHTGKLRPIYRWILYSAATDTLPSDRKHIKSKKELETLGVSRTVIRDDISRGEKTYIPSTDRYYMVFEYSCFEELELPRDLSMFSDN